MKNKDIHQLIEQQNVERKAAMYSEFEKRHNIMYEKPIKQKRSMLIASSTAVALVVICLIMIIIPLINKNDDNSVRYCSVNDCAIQDVDYTVKDYAINNNLDLLYINWYNKADDIQTKLYVNQNDSNDIILIFESIINSETGSIVKLYIVEKNISVDILSLYEEQCDKFTTIDGLLIKWHYSDHTAMTFFINKEFKYYIELIEPVNETAILDIVEEMIP